MGVTEPKTTSRQLDRWSPLTGIGFAVLFVVSAVLFDGQPSPGASDSEIRGHYADDGNQLKLESALFIATIAGVLFIGFAAGGRGDRYPLVCLVLTLEHSDFSAKILE